MTMVAADMGDFDSEEPSVRPVRDVVPQDIRVTELLMGLKRDASKHMTNAQNYALESNWDEAEIHAEIALDRIRMHNEICVEMENYR